jgi:uncharacterized membrane protein
MKIILLAIIFILLDIFMLNLLRNFFERQIFIIQKSSLQLNLLASLLCYIVLVFVLYYFIICKNRPVFEAFLLGVSIYAVYELTNKALFSKWSWTTVLVDTTWGGVLFALSTFILYLFYKH